MWSALPAAPSRAASDRATARFIPNHRQCATLVQAEPRIDVGRRFDGPSDTNCLTKTHLYAHVPHYSPRNRTVHCLRVTSGTPRFSRTFLLFYSDPFFLGTYLRRKHPSLFHFSSLVSARKVRPMFTDPRCHVCCNIFKPSRTFFVGRNFLWSRPRAMVELPPRSISEQRDMQVPSPTDHACTHPGPQSLAFSDSNHRHALRASRIPRSKSFL